MLRPASTLVSAGRGHHQPGGPVNVPVVASATYRAEGELAYGREGNPTWEAAEEVLGALEGGSCLLFASGVAAIAAVMETLPVGATVVAPADCYSGTRRLLADLSRRGRLEYRLVDMTDVAGTVATCSGADLLWLESPSNPMLRVTDVERLTRAAHEMGLAVAADNTLATPLLQRPIEYGVDVVVHSVTKLLAGHSAVVLGAIITSPTRPDLHQAFNEQRVLHGAIPGPFEAFIALLGMRTLAVRLERAQANAAELAERLVSHPSVETVIYPGLPDHPDHALAARQMSGFGSMVSFIPAKGAATANRLCASVRLCTPGTSLGGVETLIERRARWEGEESVPPGLIRLSVGIEDVEDLWADLAAALRVALGRTQSR